MSLETGKKESRVVSVFKADLETISFDLDRFVRKKKERIERIFHSSQARERIVDHLFRLAQEQVIKKADWALVLGTSLSHFPDKFTKRVYWASMLWHTEKVKYIIFTGRGDHETDDKNQAEDARRMAVSRFGVHKSVVLAAGGDNTQQNIEEARSLILTGQSLFLVSENRHLIRAASVAKANFKSKNVLVLTNPVGGLRRINPDHPSTIIELIKAEAYNHTKYRVNPNLSPEQVRHISNQIGSVVRSYEIRLHQVTHPSIKPELPFEEWVKSLPSEHTFLPVLKEQ